MVDNELKKLIELNENIINQNKRLIAQNDKIIQLLSKLAGEEKESGAVNVDVRVGEDGNVIVGENLGSSIEDDVAGDNIVQKEPETIEKDEDSFLNFKLDAGEVIFVSNSSDDEVDIFKLTVRDSDEFNVVPGEIKSKIEDEIGAVNNEIIIENLTGDGLTDQFNVPLFVAFESYNQDVPIDSARVILDDEVFDNLPEILRVAIENGAQKVHLSLKNAMAILNAPPMITNYLEFYKTREQIIDKLF